MDWRLTAVQNLNTTMTDDKKPDLKVVSLNLPGLQNVSACLRQLATAIDAGDYGAWQEVCVVLNSPTTNKKVLVFGWGLSHPSDACFLLNKALWQFGGGGFND